MKRWVAAGCAALLTSTASPGLLAQVPLAAAAAPAKPAVAEAKPLWAELPADQQAALAPLKDRWTGIDVNRKAKWIVVARRFSSLPAVDRHRLQARMTEWAAMTPAERGQARQNFQELRNLPPQDRQALWEAYRALPPEQQKELAQRARPAPRPAKGPAERTAEASAKRNVVPAVAPPPVAVKPVTPTVVQTKPGASTTLVTKPPSPPPHHQPGIPKIAATQGFVNPSTLLPRRGPQGAAISAAPAASGADPQP